MDERVAEVTQVSVKRYHGCCRVNGNGTRKLIDYKRGERCLSPTNNRYWRKRKAKYLLNRPIVKG